MRLHITRINRGVVWGHETKHCDASGCAAGSDQSYHQISPLDVEAHEVYEIDDDGTAWIPLTDDEYRRLRK